MHESVLSRRTNIIWNAVLTFIAITGLVELLLIIPWDITELKGFAFMDLVDLAQANFQIMDISSRGFDLATLLLLFFWALAGMAAGARSRRIKQGAFSSFLGAIFVVLLATGGSMYLDGLSATDALPPGIGIALGVITTMILGGLGGKLTISGAKEFQQQKDAKVWEKDDTWVCSSCGAALPPGAFVCPACGAEAIE